MFGISANKRFKFSKRKIICSITFPLTKSTIFRQFSLIIHSQAKRTLINFCFPFFFSREKFEFFFPFEFYQNIDMQFILFCLD